MEDVEATKCGISSEIHLFRQTYVKGQRHGEGSYFRFATSQDDVLSQLHGGTVGLLCRIMYSLSVF